MSNMSTHGAFAGLRAQWRRFVRDRRASAELAALSPDEFRVIAQDIGVTEAELRALGSEHPGHTELMPERMRQLGLDPEFVAQAHAATFRQMTMACSACSSWRRCARDLDKGDVHAGMDGYCANALTMDALLVEGRGDA
jgi:uncharacterized protein YjiS (DUF1127 family)